GSSDSEEENAVAGAATESATAQVGSACLGHDRLTKNYVRFVFRDISKSEGDFGLLIEFYDAKDGYSYRRDSFTLKKTASPSTFSVVEMQSSGKPKVVATLDVSTGEFVTNGESRLTGIESLDVDATGKNLIFKCDLAPGAP